MDIKDTFAEVQSNPPSVIYNTAQSFRGSSSILTKITLKGDAFTFELRSCGKKVSSIIWSTSMFCNIQNLKKRYNLSYKRTYKELQYTTPPPTTPIRSSKQQVHLIVSTNCVYSFIQCEYWACVEVRCRWWSEPCVLCVNTVVVWRIIQVLCVTLSQ